MGVDAIMFVKTTASITKRQVRQWSYELCSAFGPDKFLLDEDVDRHALEIFSDYDEYSYVPKPLSGEIFIEVNIWSRYYGERYERGDLPFIIALAMYLQNKIPASTIYYGGDSGEGVDIFSGDRRQDLWDHFVRHGHMPYLFSSVAGPKCSFCKASMNNSGGGMGKTFYRCTGCDKKIIKQGQALRVVKDFAEREPAKPEECHEL